MTFSYYKDDKDPAG